MSLWDEDMALYGPRPSFVEPVADPGTDPAVGPLVCVHFNREWLPVVLGSLLQLCQPPSWAVDDADALNGLLGRATGLLDLFGAAEACPVIEAGTVSGTVAARTPYVDSDVSFAQTYSGNPTVVATGVTDKLNVTVQAISGTGCTLRLSFDTEVVGDTAVSANWLAYQA